jgi:hypothetical protein
VSAGMDALDRGVIDAGLTAAEAVARVERLEMRVARLEARERAMYGMMREACAAAGLPFKEPRPERYLSVVKP